MIHKNWRKCFWRLCAANTALSKRNISTNYVFAPDANPLRHEFGS